jgi:single-stranded-DNA-specific exonuclease
MDGFQYFHIFIIIELWKYVKAPAEVPVKFLMPVITSRPVDAHTFSALLTQGIDPVLARLYAARGVSSAEEIHGKLTQLLPFATLKGISQMASELADGIGAGAHFLIVADYDADGATACAIGVEGLRLLGANISYLVPNRMKHGYGLSPAIVQEAAQLSPDALITVDNGIAAIDGVAAANALGIPVYVTDHHLPGDRLPDAAAIVNPNQPGCAFPSKNLAGVGVMFYVLAALRAELRSRGAFRQPSASTSRHSPHQGGAEPDLRPLLDRLALGTVADVVKLDANNRILVNQGLQRIRAGLASPGIQALFQVASRDPRKASVYDLGFMLGPRLNAAGRLQDMQIGIECLLAPTLQSALPLAQQLHEINQSRKNIEADMQDQASVLLEESEIANRHAMAVYHPEWHAGVVGILASRLKEQYHRPVIAFARGDNSELKGSGRSIPALHLRDALDWIDRRHPGLILKFGGHAMAAGLSIRKEDFTAFQMAFEDLGNAWLSPTDLQESIETDGELHADEVSIDRIAEIERAVWGQGFPQPMFEGNFTVLGQRLVGEKHLRLDVFLEQQRFEAMAFFHSEALPTKFRGVYAPMVNEYNGSARIQLRLRYWEPI